MTIDIGDTITLRRTIVATVERVSRRALRFLVSYQDEESGEEVSEWVGIEEIETW